MNIEEIKRFLNSKYGFVQSKIKVMEYDSSGKRIDFEVCGVNYTVRSQTSYNPFIVRTDEVIEILGGNGMQK